MSLMEHQDGLRTDEFMCNCGNIEQHAIAHTHTHNRSTNARRLGANSIYPRLKRNPNTHYGTYYSISIILRVFYCVFIIQLQAAFSSVMVQHCLSLPTFSPRCNLAPLILWSIEWMWQVTYIISPSPLPWTSIISLPLPLKCVQAAQWNDDPSVRLVGRPRSRMCSLK